MPCRIVGSKEENISRWWSEAEPPDPAPNDDEPRQGRRNGGANESVAPAGAGSFLFRRSGGSAPLHHRLISIRPFGTPPRLLAFNRGVRDKGSRPDPPWCPVNLRATSSATLGLPTPGGPQGRRFSFGGKNRVSGAVIVFVRVNADAPSRCAALLRVNAPRPPGGCGLTSGRAQLWSGSLHAWLRVDAARLRLAACGPPGSVGSTRACSMPPSDRGGSSSRRRVRCSGHCAFRSGLVRPALRVGAHRPPGWCDSAIPL